MTVQTLHPRPHLWGKHAALGLAGASAIVAAGFGVLTLVSDDGRATAPGQHLPSVVNTASDDGLPPVGAERLARMKLEQHR